MTTNEGPTAVGAAAPPTLYIVQTGGWGSDVAGCLVDPAVGILRSHVSSDRNWLRQDLTVNFGRLAELQAAYPDGYAIVEVEPGTATQVEAIARFFEHREASAQPTPGAARQPEEI